MSLSCPAISYHLYRVLSCHMISYGVQSCHVMTCHVVSCHVLSCLAMPCRAMPWRAVPCRAMPCHAMPFPFASCDFMPDHMIQGPPLFGRISPLWGRMLKMFLRLSFWGPSSRISPEVHQNFTGIPPEFHQKFTGIAPEFHLYSEFWGISPLRARLWLQSGHKRRQTAADKKEGTSSARNRGTIHMRNLLGWLDSAGSKYLKLFLHSQITLKHDKH